jgi:hypothetical protein
MRVLRLSFIALLPPLGYALELGHRERAPRLFQAMDIQLGAEAIAPRPGMRVRVAPRGGAPIVGTVVWVTTDTIVLQPGAGLVPQPLAVRDLGGLAVSRGSFGHAREGMLIGFVVGGLVGTVVGASRMDSGDQFVDLSAFMGFAIGGAAGGLVGGAAGSGTRTEIWSEVPRRPRP